MNRAMALLAGLLLVSQVAAQPASAADVSPSNGTVQAQSERAPGSPGTPNFPDRPDSLSAGPMADLKVELVSGWWEGNERHSRFKVSNIGTASAPETYYWYQTLAQDPIEPDTDNKSSKVQVGTMPANAFALFDVVCKPTPGYTCDKNTM